MVGRREKIWRWIASVEQMTEEISSSKEEGRVRK